MLTPEARDLLVVCMERLPTEGADVGGRTGDDEEHGHESCGPGTIDSWQKSLAKSEVEYQREYEGRRYDHYPVQPMPGGCLVAGRHPPEVEREGGGEDEQDEREGGWASAFEAEEPGENRREYPLHHE